MHHDCPVEMLQPHGGLHCHQAVCIRNRCPDSFQESDLVLHLLSWLLIRLFTACLLFCYFQQDFIVPQPACMMVLSFFRSHGCLNTMTLIQPSNWKCWKQPVKFIKFDYMLCKWSISTPLFCSLRLQRTLQCLSCVFLPNNTELPVLALQEVDGPWPSKFKSWNFFDLF